MKMQVITGVEFNRQAATQ